MYHQFMIFFNENKKVNYNDLIKLIIEKYINEV